MSEADLKLNRIPSMKEGMLIRRPPAEVFKAFADPAVTTRFWFTHSSGPLTPGATVRWEWEMYDASVDVSVQEVEDNRRIVFAWGPPGAATTVEMRFIPYKDDTTYVQITESGYTGDGDAIVARLADSTGGFTMALCAAKALLEHGVTLTVVGDHAPKGLEL